jgi:transaldolase
MKPQLQDLKIKIFADGADLQNMIQMGKNPLIKGLTTNPSLMKKAGVKDYSTFAKEALKNITGKPISFEVFSDNLPEMEEQALEIASWGKNVFVKIPITNTKGQFTGDLVKNLVNKDVKVNVTAIMTTEQVFQISKYLNPKVPSFVSIFAGRIADTGRDPVSLIKDSIDILRPLTSTEVIWASPRELLNIFQASQIGCQIITVSNEILDKIKYIGYDLSQFSLDTVKMFYQDAIESNFKV